MRPTTWKTEVGLFDPLPAETPSLFELGMPVVDTHDRWHINIGQKVPLNKDRDNVAPRFLKAVRVAVLNAAYDRLTEEDANSDWVRAASSDPNCSPDAIRKV